MRRTHTLGSLRSACGAFFWSRPEGIYNTIDIRRANGVSPLFVYATFGASPTSSTTPSFTASSPSRLWNCGESLFGAVNTR